MGPSPAGPPTYAEERLRDAPPTPAPVSAAPPVAPTAACAPSRIADPALLRLAGLVEDRVQNTSFAALPAVLDSYQLVSQGLRSPVADVVDTT